MGKSEDCTLAYKKVNEKITDRKNEVPCYFTIYVEKTKMYCSFENPFKSRNSKRMAGVPK